MDGRILKAKPAERLLNIGTTQATLSITDVVPAGAKQLIWNEFFASRNRGIDWSVHLPWATRVGALCVAVTIQGDAGEDDVIAALLVRPLCDLPVALIGYVCVDPQYRGHGLSGNMLEASAEALAAAGFEGMQLWTAKARVYEACGFSVARQEHRVAFTPPTARTIVESRSWPALGSAIGLPPFAKEGWSAETSEAHIVFADTKDGPDLLDYRGDPSAVLQVMAGAREGRWTATLAADASLYTYAAANGLMRNVSAGPLTMFRALSELHREEPVRSVQVPPAFRI